MKRQFCQLAHPFKPEKHYINGWFASLKLDGERAIWIPESRGVPAADVPWANTAKDKHEFVSTGLWTRRAKVVHAPKWWLDKLPSQVVEGELWGGVQNFQGLSSIVRTQDPSLVDWTPVQFRLFDAPPPAVLLADGIIDDKPVFTKKLEGCYHWWLERRDGFPEGTFGHPVSATCPFMTRLKYLDDFRNDVVIPHEQHKLPSKPVDAKWMMDKMFDEALEHGHEGLVLKNPFAPYICARVYDMLKYKPWSDMEATVIGYTTGRETDRGSKLLGMMGALILESDTHKEFKVSGFTDAERVLAGIWHDPPAGDFNLTAERWASQHPDCVAPNWIHNSKFPRGARVTIKYRELSDDGIPKEGRYFRNRPE